MSPSESIDLHDAFSGRSHPQLNDGRRCGADCRPLRPTARRSCTGGSGTTARGRSRRSGRTGRIPSPTASSWGADRGGAGCRPTPRATPVRNRPSRRRSTRRSRRSSSGQIPGEPVDPPDQRPRERRGASHRAPFAPGNRPNMLSNVRFSLIRNTTCLIGNRVGTSGGAGIDGFRGARGPRSGSRGRRRCTRRPPRAAPGWTPAGVSREARTGVVGSSATGYGERGMDRQERGDRASRGRPRPDGDAASG